MNDDAGTIILPQLPVAVDSSEQSQFYLTETGELNEKSFKIPSEVEIGSGYLFSRSSPILSPIFCPSANGAGESGVDESFDWDRTIKFRIDAMEKQESLDGTQIFGSSCLKQQGMHYVVRNNGP